MFRVSCLRPARSGQIMTNAMPPPGLGCPGCPVYVAASTIPGAGRGVFAARDLPKGAVVGDYCGLQVGDTASVRKIIAERAEYAYEPTSRDAGPTIYPDPYRDRDPPRGAQVPQLCNDAIHPEITGLENNAGFEEVRCGAGHARVRVVTKRAVRAGEEILLGYGYQYWRCARRPESIRTHPAVVAAEVLSDHVDGLEIHSMAAREVIPGTDWESWDHDDFPSRMVWCPVCKFLHSASLVGLMRMMRTRRDAHGVDDDKWWIVCYDVEDAVAVSVDD